MLWTLLHRLILAVTLLGFVGGMTLQLMPPKVAFAASGPAPVSDDCSHMAMPPQDTASDHAVPWHGMDPECVKQMHCLGTPSLPPRLGVEFDRFSYGKVVYWAPATVGDGRSIKPDLFPPINL